jgi:hypothetical protein
MSKGPRRHRKKFIRTSTKRREAKAEPSTAKNSDEFFSSSWFCRTTTDIRKKQQRSRRIQQRTLRVAESSSGYRQIHANLSVESERIENLDEEKSGEPLFDEQTPEKTQGE